MKDLCARLWGIGVGLLVASVIINLPGCSTPGQTVNFGSGMIDRYDYSSETYTNGPVIEVDRDQHVIRVWPAGWKVIQL